MATERVHFIIPPDHPFHELYKGTESSCFHSLPQVCSRECHSHPFFSFFLFLQCCFDCFITFSVPALQAPHSVSRQCSLFLPRFYFLWCLWLLLPATTTRWEAIIEGNLFVAPNRTVSAEMVETVQISRAAETAQAFSRTAGTAQISRTVETAQACSIMAGTAQIPRTAETAQLSSRTAKVSFSFWTTIRGMTL